ncbi:transposase, partial [Streptosporangium sp. NPDC001682]
MESNPEVRTGRPVVHHLHAHVVFVTKYRRGVFIDPMPVRCEELMGEVRADFEVEPREFNGDHDH